MMQVNTPTLDAEIELGKETKDEENDEEDDVEKSPRTVSPPRVRLSTACDRLSNIICLNTDDTGPQPKPRATRARLQGKQILERSGTSSWFQHMTESVPVKPHPRNEVPTVIQPPAEPEVKKPQEKEEEEEAQPSKEDMNMLLLRRLQEQQEVILKQQCILNQKFGEHLKASPEGVAVVEKLSTLVIGDSIDNEKDVETFCDTESVDQRENSSATSCTRRLKGDVAHWCAKRDEGTIKTLIWQSDLQNCRGHQDAYTDPDTKLPVNTRASSSVNSVATELSIICSPEEPPSRKRRNLYNNGAENSTTVQNLLSYGF